MNSDNFIEKKFRKFLIVNFRLLENFFTAEFIAKTIRKFFTVNFIEKTFFYRNFLKFFQKIRKNNFCLKNKKGSQGGNAPFFPVKSDTTFRWGLISQNRFVSAIKKLKKISDVGYLKLNERSCRILGNSRLNFACYSGALQNGITFFLFSPC